MVRIIVILLLSLPSVLLAQENQPKKEPSLAEIAKQDREKRQETTAPVRLITNEDLGSLRSARVATTESSRSSRGRRQAVKASSEDSEAEDTGTDESAEGDPSTVEYWEPAFKEAVENLKYAANASLVLELRINNFQNVYFREEDGVRRQSLYAEIAKTVEQLIQSREEEQAARQAVLDLQKDAEKAGLKPGEVRDLTGKLPEKRSIIELPDLVDPDLEG